MNIQSNSVRDEAEKYPETLRRALEKADGLDDMMYESAKSKQKSGCSDGVHVSVSSSD